MKISLFHPAWFYLIIESKVMRQNKELYAVHLEKGCIVGCDKVVKWIQL